jgi:cell division septum initiation protein DivIVA
MSEQEVTLESLAQRVEQLEKRCENVADCILDSHEEFRKMAEQINTFRKEVHEASNEAANQIIPSVLNQANRVLEEAEAKIREIAAAT